MFALPLATNVASSASAPLVLRSEAALIAVAATVAYAAMGYSWWLFGALILAPDLFMIGYLRGPRIGAWCYNLGHTYLAPAALALLGYALHQPALTAIAIIWAAHIGLDRVMGYGLKYPDDFRHTHLSGTAEIR